jgi:hypothetical protein
MSKKSYKRIKNFSTIISPEKTIMEIEKMLSEYGATKIMKEYDDKGRPIFLAFAIQTKRGEVPIKLPAKISQVLMMFDKEVSKGLLPNKYSGDKEQAFRVGWRIIKDWIDAQLTLIRLELVKPEEIFLPYIWDNQNQETLYEKLERNGFQAIGYTQSQNEERE